MDAQRGGWTLVATKVSSSFLFIKSPFSPVAAKTKNADAASHIHPSMGDWEEVMFRFADVDSPFGLFTTGGQVHRTMTRKNSTSIWWEKLWIWEKTWMDFTSTVQQIKTEIPPWVLLPYLAGTTIQIMGFQKIMGARTSGLTRGIVLTAQTTTSPPTTAGRGAPSVSRATVIWTSQSGSWSARKAAVEPMQEKWCARGKRFF